jgi:hypothetical protein
MLFIDFHQEKPNDLPQVEFHIKAFSKLKLARLPRQKEWVQSLPEQHPIKRFILKIAEDFKKQTSDSEKLPTEKEH